jgi:Ca2+-binding RTX toxin-like protein
MVTFVTTDQTSTYTLAAEEDLVLAEGVSITSNGSGIAVASGNNGGHAIAIYGSVMSSNTAVNLARTGNSLPFSNALTVGASGVVMAVNSDAVSTNSNFFDLHNLGTIQSLGSATSDHGLELFANADITNSGTISSRAGDAIRVSPTASTDSTGPQHLDNSGSIDGGANGLTYAGMWLTGVNTGTISGGAIGISVTGALGLLTFTNAGLVTGGGGTAVAASVGDDLLQNRGVLDGSVTLGDGNDVYAGFGDGVTLGRVLGEGGNDRLIGAADSDDFDGGDGKDTLSGRGGEDVLTGGTGVDALTGGAGDDELYGGTGNDSLAGGDGDDILNGGASDDDIRGGAGEDTIVGSTGRDTLRGGGAADTFVFKAADSGTGGARDVIFGFVHGEDLVDLSDVAAGTIAFLAEAPFSGTGGAEMLITASDGTSVAHVHIDGNGVAEFQIEFRGTTGLAATDFLL